MGQRAAQTQVLSVTSLFTVCGYNPNFHMVCKTTIHWSFIQTSEEPSQSASDRISVHEFYISKKTHHTFYVSSDTRWFLVGIARKMLLHIGRYLKQIRWLLLCKEDNINVIKWIWWQKVKFWKWVIDLFLLFFFPTPFLLSECLCTSYVHVTFGVMLL